MEVALVRKVAVTQLPEIEVLRKDLERDVVGKRVKEVTVQAPSVVGRHRNRPEFVKALTGHKIEALTRRGTILVFELDEDAALVVRLGSQGTVSRETANVPPSRHTQVVATFATGGALHVVDPAKDGELFVVGQAELGTLPELTPLGIDPLTDTFTWPAFSQQLKSRNAPLKQVLVDDSFIVGLGDLYSDEILWVAGLSGLRSSAGLSSQEVRRLYRAVQEVLHDAVKQGGTSDGASEPGDDLFEGEYGEFLKVSGRDGLPCARCRQPVQLVELEGGLRMYCCGNCQT